jgi:hypothetical protein
MPLGRVCSRRMATIDPDGTVEEAALQMARLGVDTLVVVEGDGTAAGVITDRDLVIRCLARSLSPRETFVGEIMTTPPPPGIQLQFLDLTIGPAPRAGALGGAGRIRDPSEPPRPGRRPLHGGPGAGTLRRVRRRGRLDSEVAAAGLR